MNRLSVYICLLLVCISLIARSQTKSIEKFQDVPVKKYTTAGLDPASAESVSEWIKRTASTHRIFIDSIFTNYKISNEDAAIDLTTQKVLIDFISANWKGLLKSNSFGTFSQVSPAFKKDGFFELAIYAKCKLQGPDDLKNKFIPMFETGLKGSGEAHQERLIMNMSGRRTYADRFQASLISIAENKSVSSSAFTELFTGYVYNQFYKEIGDVITEYLRSEEAKKYDINLHVRIPVRDGKKLHGILVIPKNIQQPLPVILKVSCYPSGNERQTLMAKVPAKYGYASLLVFNRGKAESEGTFYPFENDANDNYDVLDWISKQPWCNGKVGMYGGSYLGFAQWATVKKLHPVLKTIVPQVSVAVGIDFPNPDGVFLTYTLQWLKYVRNHKLNDDIQMIDQQRWDKINNQYMTSGIPFAKLDSLEGSGMDTVFQRWLKHPAFDDYWQSFTPTKEEFAGINIPILSMTGYFDDDQRGALYYYNMHNKYGPKEAVKNHYLFIGPFDHAGGQGWPSPSVPPYAIDSTALINQEQLVMKWFDYTLKGAKKPEFLKDRLSVFGMGENKWHYFNGINTMNKDSITYFIDHTSPNSKDLFLSPDKPSVDRTTRLIFNTASVENDTMHVFTNNNALVTENIFKRKDIVVIKTQPFEKDVMLNGAVTADLFIVSSASDADLLLTWWEEDSSGKRWPISYSMQRLSHARDKSKKTILKKNNIYHIKMNDGFWMCRKLAKGSRLIMTVSPLTDRFWQKNYGGSDDVSKQTMKNAGTISLTIYAGKNFSSRVKIPVMK